VSISSPAACSGLMYTGVPTAIPSPVLPGPGSVAIARAMPKSASMARPVARSSSTFSGLTSRCTTPAPPAASSAAATSATMRDAVSGWSRRSRVSRSRRLSPSTWSIT